MNAEGVRLVNKKSFLNEKHHMTFVQAQIRLMLTNKKPGAWCLDQWEARTWPTLRHTQWRQQATARAAFSLQADHNIGAKYAELCRARTAAVKCYVLHVCSACSAPTGVSISSNILKNKNSLYEEEMQFQVLL